MRRLTGILVGFLMLMSSGCGDQPYGQPATTSSPPSATAATTTTTDTTRPEPVVLERGPAPWSADPLSSADVPALVVDEWMGAADRTWCSALFPDDPESLAPGATLRPADFGGGWAWAWDVANRPGRYPGGEYCSDCGWGAFGVAGPDFAAAAVDLAIWDIRLTWDDGSEAGYGLEGTTVEALPGAPYLAYLVIDDQGCLYNVWSFLGEDHLKDLIDSLRFVDGLEAEPIEPQPARDAVDRGPTPWSGEPLEVGQVAGILVDEWVFDAGAPAACPLLVPDDLGLGSVGAVLRRANSDGEMLAAWDLPSGPGRYGTGDYCADCGRGAFGIGTFQGTGTSGLLPVSDRWDDGSEGRLGSEATRLSGGIPADRLAFTDPETGEPAVAPYEMFLYPAGFDCRYWVWSFLGEDHVEYLVDQLRRVKGYPA